MQSLYWIFLLILQALHKGKRLEYDPYYKEIHPLSCIYLSSVSSVKILDLSAVKYLSLNITHHLLIAVTWNITSMTGWSEQL